jgi:hypothetical protein
MKIIRRKIKPLWEEEGDYLQYLLTKIERTFKLNKSRALKRGT